MPKKLYKHKLLIDENMPGRLAFPLLNERFDLKHIVIDFKKAGVTDIAVYKLAVAQKRIILTKNIKHFIPLIGLKDDSGIIGISPNWTPPQLDSKLTAFLMKHTPASLQKKFIPF